MTEDQDAKDSLSDSGSKERLLKNKDKKSKAQRPLTKIILRRLPPTMTEEAFLEQVSPIPEHDYFYFAKPDRSLGNNLFSRAYINFVNVDDIYLFRDKFDGYVFVDDKGLEYVGIVEYAPFQRIPKKKKKKDPKCGTIEGDPVYQEFLDNVNNKDQETDNQPKLEYSYPINDVSANDKKNQSTPLLEYLSARKLDKRGRDERRRRENDKRKMKIERKVRDYPIKKAAEIYEDANIIENNENHNEKYINPWFGERRIYHKNKNSICYNTDKQHIHGSDEFIESDIDWDSHFPALFTKAHNAFTLTSGKFNNKKYLLEGSQKSAGDTYLKEEEFGENDVKKIKTRDWDKDRHIIKQREDRNEIKDSNVFESKVYKDQRKSIFNVDRKKKFDNDQRDNTGKDDDHIYELDRGMKKDVRKDKFKEIKSEPRVKKYSDTRKERIKQSEMAKSEKVTEVIKASPTRTNDFNKSKMNHDDIKPFTQLPQVKTDDLTNVIEYADKKLKIDEKTTGEDYGNNNCNEEVIESVKFRRNSEGSTESAQKYDTEAVIQKHSEERSKSTERDGSEEKEKSESSDRRTERRIRNKDRPSLVIYQPGMGRFSKQRLAQKETSTLPVMRSVNANEKIDT